MSSKKYIPMDLAFEHYAHVKQDLNSFEYAKICAEMSNPRYVTVTEAEGLDLYMKGELLLPDKVRVVWMHDVERPNDNLLARRMAEMEHAFGFRSSFNIRVVCAIDDEWRQDLLKIAELGDHDIEYQHEDLVITQGDQTAGLESFRSNLAYLRTFFPKIRVAFGHGVYKSGIDSAALFRTNGEYDQKLLDKCGLPKYGEFYFFMSHLRKELGDRFRHVSEGTNCYGGDDFVAELKKCREGDVMFFLQHPTWWSSNYDFNDLKRIMRKSVFFH